MSRHRTRGAGTGTAAIFMLVALSICLLPAFNANAEPVTKKFCIQGNSDEVGWSWGIVVNEACQCSDTELGPVDPDNGVDDPTEFAAAFVASINAAGGPFGISAAVDPVRPNCFTITREDGDFQFWVGDAAGTPCSGQQVTNNPDGVEFNPLIMEAPGTVPTLTEWGLIILALILLGAMTWVILKRRNALPASA